MCYFQIWQNFGNDKYLCKLDKEYLNASLSKFVVYSLQHSKTFDVLHVFLPLTVAELSTLKLVRFFCPPCISPYNVTDNNRQMRCRQNIKYGALANNIDC